MIDSRTPRCSLLSLFQAGENLKEAEGIGMSPLTLYHVFQQKGLWLFQKFDLAVCDQLEVSSLLCRGDSHGGRSSTLAKWL